MGSAFGVIGRGRLRYGLLLALAQMGRCGISALTVLLHLGTIPSAMGITRHAQKTIPDVRWLVVTDWEGE